MEVAAKDIQDLVLEGARLREERDALRLRLAEVERERDEQDTILSAYAHKEHACEGDVCEVCAGNGACCEHRDQQTKEIERLTRERDEARRVAKRLAEVVDEVGRERGYGSLSHEACVSLDAALAYEVEP